MRARASSRRGHGPSGSQGKEQIAAAAPVRRARKPDSARELEAALAEYRIIFDNAIIGICFTRERVLVRCNSRFEEMFGYTPGELDGREVRMLYESDEAYERIGNYGYARLLQHSSYTDERVMLRKNGERFWCNVSGKTLDSRSPFSSAIWIFQDISERKRAEEDLQRAHERLEQRVLERTDELRAANLALQDEMAKRAKTEEALLASREKYRVLFETFPIGISITDDRGRVIEINQALERLSSRAMLSTLMGSRRSGSPVALIHPDGSTVTASQLPSARALKEQRVIADVELGVRYPNARVRWFTVTAAPIPVKGHGVVIAHTETTERRHMDELERQRRAELAHGSRLNMMGEMAATLAHELGQPLSATLNYLHGCQLRLESGESDVELLQSAISQAIRQAEQAGAIVNHMRQFVRRAAPESVPTKLNNVIEEMIGFLDFERRQQRVTVQTSLCEDLPEPMTDPLEMRQVMVNLIKNGIEAMSETDDAERVLEITTQWDDRRWIEVSVADRGAGMTKKERAQIFTPFFTTKPNGLGLGLAICRSIIEAHGGRLTAAGNGHGGTTFRFTLPCETSA